MVAALPNSLRIRSKLFAALANTFVPLPVYPETDRTLVGSAGADDMLFDFLVPNPPALLPPPPDLDFDR